MYSKEDLLEIYYNLKKGIIIKKELLPIKKELLLIIKHVNFKNLIVFNDLINILLVLYKENKINIITNELINYIKLINDDSYLPVILSGITFNSNRLTNDINVNEKILNMLGFSFHGISRILLKDDNSYNYLKTINSIYMNIALEYFNAKEKLMIKDYKKQDMFVLLNVLELITTYIYINIDEFNYDYSLINKYMDKIENNIIEYFVYFVKNKLWCVDIGIIPKSVGGYKQEFIVLGNLVKQMYSDEQKKLKM